MSLCILELDITALNLSQTKNVQVFPDGVPAADGLIICYDASRESTFLPIADLIREYSAVSLRDILIKVSVQVHSHPCVYHR